MKPVVIAVAATGAVPCKKDYPALPITAAERIESRHKAETASFPATIYEYAPAMVELLARELLHWRCL